jgi:hypothetical protein
MSSFPRKPIDAQIFSGRIISVDPSRWTCVVRCDQVQREFVTGIISSVYQSATGAGLHYMPEVGSHCLVAVSSDHSGAYLIAGAPLVSSVTTDGKPGSYHSNRPYLSPGDMACVAEGQNGVFITRNGTTELRGSGLSRIVAEGRTDTLTVVARHMIVETIGSTEEKVCIDSEDAGTFFPAFYYETTVREFAQSPSWSVRSKVGFTEADRVELDGSVPIPALSSQQTTLYIEDPLLGLIPEDVIALRPSSLDPAACVYLFEVNSDEEADVPDQSLSLKVARSGSALLTLDGKLRIAQETDAGTAQPVMLGTEFLTKLQASLTEIKVALNTLGFTTAATDDLLSDIVDSLAGQGSFLSSVLEAD